MLRCRHLRLLRDRRTRNGIAPPLVPAALAAPFGAQDIGREQYAGGNLNQQRHRRVLPLNAVIFTRLALRARLDQPPCTIVVIVRHLWPLLYLDRNRLPAVVGVRSAPFLGGRVQR